MSSASPPPWRPADPAAVAAMTGESGNMTALIIQLPLTPAGRDLLREVLRSIRSAETRLFVVSQFDRDGSAEEDRRRGFAPVHSAQGWRAR
jgi:hypothetical protein